MRLAYIDHRLNEKATFSNDIIKYAKDNAIDMNVAETFKEFNQKHGTIIGYDGLIIHPGHKNIDAMIEFMQKNATPIVLVAAGVLEYQDDFNNVKVFDYLDRQGLFNPNNYQSGL